MENKSQVHVGSNSPVEKESLAVQLVRQFYARQTGYSVRPHKILFDGLQKITVFGYVKDLPRRYQQIGSIQLFQEEEGGTTNIVNDQITRDILPATWFDEFTIEQLTGVRNPIWAWQFNAEHVLK